MCVNVCVALDEADEVARDHAALRVCACMACMRAAHTMCACGCEGLCAMESQRTTWPCTHQRHRARDSLERESTSADCLMVAASKNCVCMCVYTVPVYGCGGGLMTKPVKSSKEPRSKGAVCVTMAALKKEPRP